MGARRRAQFVIGAAALGALTLLSASPSLAQEAGLEAPVDETLEPEPGAEVTAERGGDESPKAWETEEAERRSGFHMGLTLGTGLGSAAGFPNDAKLIGKESAYTETGVGVGSDMRLWLGGALTDWLNFGAGLDLNGFSSDGLVSGQGVLVLHAEAFPLYGLGGQWRDVGAMLEGGTGSALTTPEDDPDTKIIDGGAISHISGGVFWEGIRFWRMAMGPFVEMKYSWSQSVRRPFGVLGWRTALYVGP